MPVLVSCYGSSDLRLLIGGQWQRFHRSLFQEGIPEVLERIGYERTDTHLPQLLEILQRTPVDQWVSWVRFPILEATLKKLVRMAHWPEGWTWFPVETSQQDPRFHASDTEGMTKVVLQYLRYLESGAGAPLRRERGLPDRLLPDPPTRHIHPLRYTSDPADYVEALQILRARFQEKFQRYPDLQREPFYLLVGPGTPALNVAFVISLTERLPASQLELLQAREARQGSAETLVKTLALAPRLKQWPLRRTLQALLDQYDYAGVARILQDLSGQYIWPEEAIQVALHLAYYGDARLNLDFQEAQSHLEHTEGQIRPDQWRRLYALPSSTPQTPKDRWLLVHELVWNARVVLKRNMFHDFLGRIFRFLEVFPEVLLRHLEVVHPSESRLQASHIQRSDLLDCARRLFVDPNGVPVERRTPQAHTPLRIQNDLNRSALLGLFYCAGKAGLLPSDWETTWEHIQVLSWLAQLRNRSIIAHGWEPLSRRSLEETIGSDPETFVFPALKDMLAWWENFRPDWKPEIDPADAFQCLNDLILEFLGEE